jgi:predicted ABC-type ATPase
MSSRRRPVIYLIAGCNGAGKTTFAREFLEREVRCLRFMNADELARGLSPLAPGSARLKAGRLLIAEIQAAIAEGASFGWETTLSGRAHFQILNRARNRFEIELHYLALRHPKTALRRIRLRVRQGGHDVPAVDVRRRFIRSVRNFVGLYAPIADRWTVWDAELSAPAAIAESRTTRLDDLRRILAL